MLHVLSTVEAMASHPTNLKPQYDCHDPQNYYGHSHNGCIDTGYCLLLWSNFSYLTINEPNVVSYDTFKIYTKINEVTKCTKCFFNLKHRCQ